MDDIRIFDETPGLQALDAVQDLAYAELLRQFGFERELLLALHDSSDGGSSSKRTPFTLKRKMESSTDSLE